MNDPANSIASYNDILDLPEHLVGEIIGGQLYTSPRPAPKHALVYSNMGYTLGGPFHQGIGGPGGWWIIDEPELHLGADIVVPDLAGWRRERLPELPDSAWFELPPDWVCEILSPSTAQNDRGVKMPIYAREGVRHLWLIDPDLRTLEAYTLSDNGLWSLLGTLSDDAPVSVEPFDAIEFPLDRLWA